ncbi:MAG: radical SAM family heme chaperone HemW [Bdellovibrionota bacterium]
MAFGIYVHVPYCLQLCPYCDFTKYELGPKNTSGVAPEAYADLVRKEIRSRARGVPRPQSVSTVYFGGGTPSLLEPSNILAILGELANEGLRLESGAEVTIEIDPATCDQARLDAYLAMGINRFSVGAQTFNERLLKIAGRKHTSRETIELLDLMRRNNVNYSFDLLFALPSQTLDELRDDLTRALSFSPSHVSAYCLTVPEGHKLSVGRAPEDEQIQMFDIIEDTLATGGIHRYEISNFAKPGAESRHNILYWTDSPYWGIGLSSHSYLTRDALAAVGESAEWGARFWNTRSMKTYADQLSTGQPTEWSFLENLPGSQFEKLAKHQALTDFLHTGLRPLVGFEENALRLKFGDETSQIVLARLEKLRTEKLVALTKERRWSMTREGRLIANVIFEKLTFLQGEEHE